MSRGRGGSETLQMKGNFPGRGPGCVGASFAQYAGTVCRSHLEKAVALWGHLTIMMSCQNRTTSGWWRTYDESLRHSYFSMEDARFELNQCLFIQAMVENSEVSQRAPTPVPLPVAQARLRKRRALACFA